MIVAVLVNWGKYEVTRECIRSLLEAANSELAIVLVDNESNETELAAVRKKFPSVEVVANERNEGFCRASNQGIARALERGADYVLVLNNDTVVDGGFFSAAEETIRRWGDRAIVVPKILWYGERERIWFCGGKLNLWTGVYRNLYAKQRDDKRIEEAVVDIGSGCCLLVPAACFEKAGGFDRNLFMYCEDLDFSLRIRGRGYSLVVSPETRIYHHVSLSGREATADRRYYMTRNLIWVLSRHGTFGQRVSQVAFLTLRTLFRIGRLFLGSDWDGVKAELRGFAGGMFAAAPTANAKLL